MVDDFFAEIEGLVCNFYSLKSLEDFHHDIEAAHQKHRKRANDHNKGSSSASKHKGKGVERLESTPSDEHLDLIESLDPKKRAQFEAIEAIEAVFAETREIWRKGMFRREERRRTKQEKEAKLHAKRFRDFSPTYSTRNRAGEDREKSPNGQESASKTIPALIDELRTLEFADLLTDEPSVLIFSLFFRFFYLLSLTRCPFSFVFPKKGSSRSKKPREGLTFEKMKQRAEQGDYASNFLELEKDFFILTDQFLHLHHQDPQSSRVAEKLRVSGVQLINRFLRGHKDLLLQVQASESTPCQLSFYFYFFHQHQFPHSFIF